MNAVLVLALVHTYQAAAVPIEETSYGRAVLRIEGRGDPLRSKEAEARRAREGALADAGAQARWIQIVDNEGGPYIENPYIPCDYPDAEEREATLKAWVADMHEAGMCVMSWYPLTFSKSAWRAHPDWRQVYIEPWRPEDFLCCIETGYGDALINYCIYAIETLGLDGIWFDGSVWTAIWERPVPLSCACDSCKRKFKADSGLEVPTGHMRSTGQATRRYAENSKQDWDDPTFRAWVKWRYREFGEYIGRLAGAIREKHPDAAVVINHYHRPGIPWQSAIPIDRYDADIISGSEAFSPDTLDLTMRLCRAYGRSQAEVWRPFSLPAEPEQNAEALLEHALICYSVGGYPAFGGDPYDAKMAPTAALMTPIMNEIHPLVGGESVPYAALHVSQQTETFFYGRGGAGSNPIEPYWTSLGNWTKALGEAHIAPEYVYDADFAPERLARHPVVFMPLSLALTDEQARTGIQYIRAGGTVVLGLGAGNLDAEGQPKGENLLGKALGFSLEGLPAPDGSDSEMLELWPEGGGRPVLVSAMRTPLRLLEGKWRTLYRAGRERDAPPVAATRKYGKGRVFVLDTDPAATFGSTPVSGGKTELYVTDGIAAGGEFSLKYVDANIAPQTFYPDLENKLPPFAEPEFSGGELECDLRVGENAHVSIEIRSTLAPIPGPVVGLGPGGKITTGGQAICDLPFDEWVHLRIAYRFALEGEPSTYEVTVTLPDGQTHSASGTSLAQGYRRTDWLVVYGAGAQPATFYLDNLSLVGIRPDGSTRTALDLSFEEGPEGLRERTALLRELAEHVTRYARPAIEVDAPDHVRAGAFRRDDDRVVVHLHDRDGRRTDWLGEDGPEVVLRCAFPVASARLAIPGESLPVREVAGRYEIRVPSVGLYQVVEIRRRTRERSGTR